MNKRELFQALANLGDEDEVVLALTFPKPEEEDGFTLGEDTEKDSSDSDDEDEDDDDDNDDGTKDNGDGTMTEFYPIDSAEVESYNDEGIDKKVAFINVEMEDDEDDEDDEEDDESGSN